MATSFEYYIGERVMIGGILKDDNNTPVTNANLVARISQGQGKYQTIVGEEPFVEGSGGAYAIDLDTNKYNGCLLMRVYLVDNGNYKIVGEGIVNLIGKQL